MRKNTPPVVPLYLGIAGPRVIAPGLGVDAVLGVDTHPVVAVLDPAEIEVRRGSEEPAVELAEDVEDVLSEVLVLVDVAAVEGLARVGVGPHAVPLLEERGASGRQCHLLATLCQVNL